MSYFYIHNIQEEKSQLYACINGKNFLPKKGRTGEKDFFQQISKENLCQPESNF